MGRQPSGWASLLVPPPLRWLWASLTLWLLQPFSTLLLGRWSALAMAGSSGLLGLALSLGMAAQLRRRPAGAIGAGGSATAPPRGSRARRLGALVLYGLSGRAGR